jgi:hypothetical protein
VGVGACGAEKDGKGGIRVGSVARLVEPDRIVVKGAVGEDMVR